MNHAYLSILFIISLILVSGASFATAQVSTNRVQPCELGDITQLGNRIMICSDPTNPDWNKAFTPLKYCDNGVMVDESGKLDCIPNPVEDNSGIVIVLILVAMIATILYFVYKFGQSRDRRIK